MPGDRWDTIVYEIATRLILRADRTGKELLMDYKVARLLGRQTKQLELLPD